MTNMDLFFALIAVASLALTIYFGSKRQMRNASGSCDLLGGVPCGSP